jgi:peptide/nickel transport system substrate-binding protein
MAALLAGDVEAIDDVPPSDAGKLAADPAVNVLRGRSNSALFLHMDQLRDQTPFVTDKAGTPLPRNPFKDQRVRLAISKAMNRQALVDRMMEGAAMPAGSLLAEAGYPNGFAVTIHGPSGRYVNDTFVAQAVAPMLVRIGIDTKVVVQPWAPFIAAASPPGYAYSLILIGNPATTGEASFGLRVQFATVNVDKGNRRVLWLTPPAVPRRPWIWACPDAGPVRPFGRQGIHQSGQPTTAGSPARRL